jgi:CO dehydrogenase/acetyl-CoA synthase beta subunit
MSSHPEEIEDGEIVDEEEMSEEEEEEEEEMSEEGEMMFEDEGTDIAALMTSLLATEEGDTICTALVNIAQQLQTQNKILIKMLSQMKN